MFLWVVARVARLRWGFLGEEDGATADGEGGGGREDVHRREGWEVEEKVTREGLGGRVQEGRNRGVGVEEVGCSRGEGRSCLRTPPPLVSLLQPKHDAEKRHFASTS